jgi:hypothetical protein
MVRLMAITLAAVLAIAAGSTFHLPAMARGGMGHAAFGRAAGFGHFMGGRSFAFRDRFAFRHRFFGPGLAFVGAPYAYYDSCYSRVWTAWGWRWVNVCY